MRRGCNRFNTMFLKGMGFPYSSVGKNLSAMQETSIQFLGQKIPWRRNRLPTPVFLGFPCGSAGKESACNAGDLHSIPRSGRSLGEGVGYPLQYSWTSLVVQLVKNLPTMQEIWVWSLSWEDSLEMGKPTHSSILAWRIPWTIEKSMGLRRVRHS